MSEQKHIEQKDTKNIKSLIKRARIKAISKNGKAQNAETEKPTTKKRKRLQ